MASRRISSKFIIFTRPHSCSPLPPTSIFRDKLDDPFAVPSPLTPINGAISRKLSDVSVGFGAFSRGRRSGFFLPLGVDPFFGHRHYSSGEGSENIDYMNNVAEVLTEKSVDVVMQAPVVSEVAVAAADSFFPVAVLQYVIDGVHTFTGLNWWAAIAVTTILIRGATIPLLLSQLKATSKLSLMRPELEKIKQQMQSSLDPRTIEEGKERMQKLFKQYGVTPWTPMKGLFIQGPVFISFFMAINNMVEKVPSFKGGGAFWFVDLTTPDNLYIFPVMTSLTFLVTVELNMQEGMEGNPVAGTMKKFSRIMAVLTIPFTMSFPKAIFCYWVTSNLFSLMYGLASMRGVLLFANNNAVTILDLAATVIKRPPVKKFLGLPLPDSAPQTNFSLFGESKMASQSPASQLTVEQPKLPDKKISSSSVISQRLRYLERNAKARKKNKKR